MIPAHRKYTGMCILLVPLLSKHFTVYIYNLFSFYVAEIAQVVERFTRNEQVDGSNPFLGSKL